MLEPMLAEHDEGGRRFVIYEPTPAEVSARAGDFARWYNAPRNAEMMEATARMTAADVEAFWSELRAGGGRGFFAAVDGEIVGDLDLRNRRGDAAEFAIMIGEGARQGRGLGRAFGGLLHVVAFRELGLARLYAPSRPDNAPMRGLAAALGYVDDASDEARAYADGPTATVQSVSRDAFVSRHSAWIDAVRVRPRFDGDTSPG